jgi:hypothetical protein
MLRATETDAKAIVAGERQELENREAALLTRE